LKKCSIQRKYQRKIIDWKKPVVRYPSPINLTEKVLTTRQSDNVILHVCFKLWSTPIDMDETNHIARRIIQPELIVCDRVVCCKSQKCYKKWLVTGLVSGTSQTTN